MTHRNLALAAVATALAALPASALAQPDWGVFSGLVLTSDYRFQGVSSSDNHPALQGYVHWQNKAGLFVGAFASQVDYNDYGTSYEVDVYAGRHFTLADGRTQITPQLMYSSFPDNETPGPTYDFLQAKLSVERTEGKLNLKATTAFTPQASYGAGQAGLLEGRASYALTDRLKIDAGLGRYWVDKRPDRTFWSLGGSYQWKTVTFDLRYEATDLSRQECGYNPGICGPAVIGKLTVALPPIY